MEDTIAIHVRHSLRQEIFDQLISSAEYNESVLSTLAKLDRTRYEPVIVSGGFRELARRARNMISESSMHFVPVNTFLEMIKSLQ